MALISCDFFSETLEMGPGDHEWGLWDTEIREVIAWLGFPG